MRADGILIIDDVDILSCHLLKMFLSSELHWNLLTEIENFAIYKKMGMLPTLATGKSAIQ
jgi:hypothetical protein